MNNTQSKGNNGRPNCKCYKREEYNADVSSSNNKYYGGKDLLEGEFIVIGIALVVGLSRYAVMEKFVLIFLMVSLFYLDRVAQNNFHLLLAAELHVANNNLDAIKHNTLWRIVIAFNPILQIYSNWLLNNAIVQYYSCKETKKHSFIERSQRNILSILTIIIIIVITIILLARDILIDIEFLFVITESVIAILFLLFIYINKLVFFSLICHISSTAIIVSCILMVLSCVSETGAFGYLALLLYTQTRGLLLFSLYFMYWKMVLPTNLWVKRGVL